MQRQCQSASPRGLPRQIKRSPYRYRVRRGAMTAFVAPGKVEGRVTTVASRFSTAAKWRAALYSRTILHLSFRCVSGNSSEESQSLFLKRRYVRLSFFKARQAPEVRFL